MTNPITGRLPAPHDCIEVSIEHWYGATWYIRYTGTPKQLVAAAVVDEDMERKIVSQKGARVGKDGFPFKLKSRIPAHVQWARDEAVVFQRKVNSYDEDVLKLPGMRALCPDGLPEAHEKEPLEQALTNENDSTISWLDRCAASAQQRVGGSIMKRERTVGRFQRPVSWASVNGLLLIPDFVKIRALVIVGRGN